MYRFYLLFLTLCFITIRPCYATEELPFTGSWIASGERHIFAESTPLELYNYHLTGHINLHGSGIAGENDFWAKCNAIGSSRGEVVARCLWKDLDGNSLLLNLESIEFERGRQVLGVILRGNGPYEGATGELLFTWSSMFHSEETKTRQIHGVASDIKGRYILPEPKLN